MKSSLETLEGNKVKLSIEVDEAEFDRDVDRAFKEIGREVKLPGFRAGKVPRRVLEARIGLAPAREQAMRDGIPNYVAQAVREQQLDVIAPPEVEVTAGADSGLVTFDATCELRPEIELSGYEGLQVTLANPDVTDTEVDEEIDAERKRHGELTDVDRPARTGDMLTLDLVGSRDGEDLAGLRADDWAYELGQGWVADDFDERLEGASVGDELEFSSTPKGAETEADFRVSVRRVQEIVAPGLTDEWVTDTLGEDSVEAYRQSVRNRLAATKLGQTRSQVMPAVSEALVALVGDDIPDAMVQTDLRSRVDNAVRQLQSRGLDVEQFFSATGQDADSFVESLRGQSEQAVRLDLALRSIATAESVEASDVEVDAEIEAMAIRFGQSADDIRAMYDRNGAIENLRSELRKGKALRWLLDRVDFVDADGNPIDRDVVMPAKADHDHDHDSGHEHQAVTAADSESQEANA